MSNRTKFIEKYDIHEDEDVLIKLPFGFKKIRIVKLAIKRIMILFYEYDKHTNIYTDNFSGDYKFIYYDLIFNDSITLIKKGKEHHDKYFEKLF
jgi:hypothetical protein